MEVIEVVAAVITRADGRVLACRRAPGKASAGLWEFPGGKVEPGEVPQEALARELREELGLTASIGELVIRATTSVGSTGIDLASYRVAVDELTDPTSTDHDELRWLRPRALRSVIWAAPDLPTVDRLETGQSSE